MEISFKDLQGIIKVANEQHLKERQELYKKDTYSIISLFEHNDGLIELRINTNDDPECRQGYRTTSSKKNPLQWNKWIIEILLDCYVKMIHYGDEYLIFKNQELNSKS
jgi:hypothetical protein